MGKIFLKFSCFKVKMEKIFETFLVRNYKKIGGPMIDRGQNILIVLVKAICNQFEHVRLPLGVTIIYTMPILNGKGISL